MELNRVNPLVGATLFIGACLLVSGAAIAQDIQVRSEVLVSGSTAADDVVDGVIVPDLLDEITGVAYTDWVAPAGNRDFQTIDFLPLGGLLVRDGTVFREFLFSGERISDAFPVDCTKLKFQSPKGQGLQDTFLSDCTSSVVRNDNTMRICGSVKGQGLKCIAYDLNAPGGDCAAATLPTTLTAAEARTCAAVRTTAEPPPQLTDAFSDDSNFAELRWGVDASGDIESRILIAGDRKSIFAIEPASPPFAIDSEDTVQTIATFGGGLKINAFTTLKESLIVAFESGELRRFNVTTGVDEHFYQHPICGDRKTPQGFALRSGPDEELVLALNKACGTVAVLRLNEETGLVEVIDTDEDAIGTFLLSNTSSTEPDFLGEGVVARAGESGSFLDCLVGLTCDLARTPGAATQSNTNVVAQNDFDPSYRIFESYLSDCRWTGTRPCPIVNCPLADTYTATSPSAAELAACPPKEEQVLNLTELTLRAEPSGELATLLPDPPPVVTVPAWLRGDETFPGAGLLAGTRVDNDYEFYSLFAVSEVLIAGTFDLVLEVDLFRLDEFGNSISNDPSDVILAPDATAEERLAEVEDRSNAVIHNRETYNTVARGFPEDVGTDRKNGVLIDAGTGSKPARGFQWSAVTTGLQTYFDDAVGYLELAKQQLAELQAHKEEFLCRQFADPEGVLVGPVLSSFDCGLLQQDLDQIKFKTATCHAALLKPQQGASRENCNALFSQIDNLLETLELEITRPALTDFDVIAPNYLGEFESRTLAYRFTTEEWLLPVTPNGGIAAPLTEILAPADGSSFVAGNPITFRAVSEDSSPIVVPVTGSIVWQSNRDGALGSGGTISTALSEGVHIITATATDSDGLPGSASIVIYVAPAP